jgi:glucokinase
LTDFGYDRIESHVPMLNPKPSFEVRVGYNTPVHGVVECVAMIEAHRQLHQETDFWGCVDIGGTKVAVSLARNTLDGVHWVGRWTEATQKAGPPDALAAQVLRMLDQAAESANVDKLTAVGVSSCGPFRSVAGLIELASPNICGGLAGPGRELPNRWTSIPLEGPLRQQYAVVRIANDGVAALEAERLWGALRGVPNCAYVTWSTGIGGGLCVDGHVLRGKNSNAGHIGHMLVGRDAGALCGCGNRDDVEALISGSSLPHRFGRDAGTLVGAARSRDAEAVEIVSELCSILGRAIYNLAVTLDLSAVSLGGSIFFHHHEFLLPQITRELERRLPALTRGVQLVPAGLGERVGDYAALALVAPELASV